VFTFGCGFEGQIGNGQFSMAVKPHLIHLLDEDGDMIKAKKIRAGGFAASLVTERDELFVWGFTRFMEEKLISKP